MGLLFSTKEEKKRGGGDCRTWTIFGRQIEWREGRDRSVRDTEAKFKYLMGMGRKERGGRDRTLLLPSIHPRLAAENFFFLARWMLVRIGDRSDVKKLTQSPPPPPPLLFPGSHFAKNSRTVFPPSSHFLSLFQGWDSFRVASHDDDGPTSLLLFSQDKWKDNSAASAISYLNGHRIARAWHISDANLQRVNVKIRARRSVLRP